MSLEDLTRDQLISLKQMLLVLREESVSLGELAEADTLISDMELAAEYGDTDFSEDDFA